MICPSCQQDNPDDKRFCGSCGTPLALGCPACGVANPPSNRFCGDCGTALRTAPNAEASGAAEARAERRLVSVLFADLVGFTTLAEGRDAEETRDLLANYFELCRGVIDQYGGTVEKFIGDAVMAVWGTPVAREDDAERSVRAGLELVEAVRALHPDVRARAGIATGEAAVTVGATGQGMVAGDLVNTASRLQSVAPVGAVLVNDATYRAASKAIAFEAVGDQALKGKSLPVAAWAAGRVVAELGGRYRREGLEPPFVGRDDELRLLKQLYHATVREARPRLVSITGSAGIGKSRLTWEFEKYVDGLVADTWWHRGRSPASGEGVTFWALGEMVRGRAGLLETADEAASRQAIAATVAEWITDEAERRWIEPALLALLGLESGIAHEQLFGAWRTFFERMARRGPVVLVFEELHWADSGTLDFLEHLTEWSRGVPLFIITLARPELLVRRPDWGAGRRAFTSLYLDPLGEPAMRALLEGLVASLPAAATRAIIARAEGVPLYAVETVRMLVAEGRLTRNADGAYVPTGDLTAIAVPETLTALIAARLDALDPVDRSLILDAAVLGHSFSPASLAAISQIPAGDIESRLRSLVRRELLEHEADPRSPELGQYVFVQALIREIAYNTIGRRDKKARHLAAARHFEALDTGELAGAVAAHYIAARENASDGAEQHALAAQARIALKGAAQRAADLGAHDQAISYLMQAIAITADPGEQADLLERAGESAAVAARYDTSAGLFQRALELYTRQGDRRASLRVTAAYARALLYAFRSDEALPLLEQASRDAADLAHDPVVIALDGQLARACMLHSEMRRAIEVADTVLERAEHAGLIPVIADTLVTRGSALNALGRSIEGTAVIRHGGELAEANGLTATTLRALLNRSEVESLLDPRTGFVTAKAGLDLARRLGDRRFGAELTGHAALDAIRTGDWDWATAELDAQLADELEAADRALPLAIRMEIAAARGDDFSAAAAELEEIARATTDPQLEWTGDVGRAWTAFAGGHTTEMAEHWTRAAARFSLRAALSLSWAVRARIWAGQGASVAELSAAYQGLGSRGPALDATRASISAAELALSGGADAALPAYRDALRRWRDLGLAWDEALTVLDMATLLDPRLPEVAEAVATARETLSQLGAVVLVRRLDGTVARPPQAAGSVTEASVAATADAPRG